MDEISLTDSNAWLDWAAVFGYIGFAAFIAWRVFITR